MGRTDPESPPPRTSVEITVCLPAFVVGGVAGDEWTPWCLGCGRDIADGQVTVKLGGLRMHEGCARQRLDPTFPRAAWIAVAEHIAAAPSRHRAASVRAALWTLAAMLREAGTDGAGGTAAGTAG
ncbi:hypothetical protein HCA58_05225 [Micromonospora sp. HNM0581]|uniref:hypothetical protein n=1 Tax=Micromonospora sp. HNM0581 TaxID=2716341 RepID=UPI00146D7C94|nr:hypothetical protein [Micromonospora sp. HNM0581]NLU77807.1 hypothetical protein [Micromonospora sp. HNM0581]